MITPRTLVPAVVSLVALAGCVNGPDVDTAYLEEHTAAAPSAVEGPAVRVEQAERALDVGRDVAGARKTLEAIAADQGAPADVRDRATIALSRACEMLKDNEAAVAAIEGLLGSHADDRNWPARETAEKRLRMLLTGNTDKGLSYRRPEQKAAPFARVLAGYFPTKKDQPTEISILAFGYEGQHAEKLGLFHVGDALRELADETCPLCDTKVRVGEMSSRMDSWTAIPGAKARLATSLAVFYTHLGDPIPARYDALLPIPMSEVLPYLQKGEGVIVAKERPNAPPVILLAAPRAAQLDDIEDALAQMKTLPASPTGIKLTPGLKPEEIRTALRSQAMPALKKCYEDLLSRSKASAGRADIGFVIKADGTIDDMKIETTDTLREGTFERCMNDAVTPLRFPATGQPTTVKYPLSFAP